MRLPRRKRSKVGRSEVVTKARPPDGAFAPGLPADAYPFTTLEHLAVVVIGIVHLGPSDRVEIRLTGDLLEVVRWTETTNGLRRRTVEDVPIKWAAELWDRHNPRHVGVVPNDLWRSFDELVATAAARCKETE